MSGAFASLIRRDLILAWRQAGGAGSAVAFILCVIVMVPLALGPDRGLLARLAPGILWMALLLAVMLTTDTIFRDDHDDGTLDFLATAALPLELVCLAKALAHVLAVSLPLAIAAPVAGLLLGLEPFQLPPIMAAMALGAVGLSMIASMAGAVTAGLRRGSLLVSLLVLPLYVPILIFGLQTGLAGLGPEGPAASFVILFALVLVSAALQPWAAAAALRAYHH